MNDKALEWFVSSFFFDFMVLTIEQLEFGQIVIVGRRVNTLRWIWQVAS